MNNLIIDFNQEHNFYKITCLDEYFITEYKDTEDIINFYDTSSVYCPGSMTVEEIKERFHTITEEERNVLMEQKKKVMESKNSSGLEE